MDTLQQLEAQMENLRSLLQKNLDNLRENQQALKRLSAQHGKVPTPQERKQVLQHQVNIAYIQDKFKEYNFEERLAALEKQLAARKQAFRHEAAKMKLSAMDTPPSETSKQ